MVTYRHIYNGRIVEIEDARSIEMMDAASKWIRVEDEPEPEPDSVDDGIYHRGGPWFDVTVDGDTVKVQGRQNAEDRYGEMGGI